MSARGGAPSGLVFALMLGGCGPPPEPVSVRTTITSEEGQFLIDVAPAPDPPIRGTNQVTYTITDTRGAARDGLALTVLPWMASHGHGASVHPEVHPEGGGVYRIEQVVFFMPGRWELRTTIGNGADHAAPEFQVP